VIKNIIAIFAAGIINHSSMNKINIANPIYDSVFKYLVEDNRIAKTLLSALLKKEIVKVEIRPHEYTNVTKNAIAMFRIDFKELEEKDKVIEEQKNRIRAMVQGMHSAGMGIETIAGVTKMTVEEVKNLI